MGVDELGVEEMGVGKTGVDEIANRQSGMTPDLQGYIIFALKHRLCVLLRLMRRFYSVHTTYVLSKMKKHILKISS